MLFRISLVLPYCKQNTPNTKTKKFEKAPYTISLTFDHELRSI
jgi:hypothetical protein